MACPIPLISTSPSSDSKFTQRSFALVIGWLLFSLPVAHARASSFVQTAANAAAQSAQDVRPLEPGKAIDREMAGGQTHTYQITLQAGQFLRVVVEQQGIDVAVALVAPDSKQITEVNLLSGTFGQESLSYEAAVNGDYQIVVRASAATAPKGAYQVRPQVKAAATAQDKQRIAAERLLAEAYQLSRQGTAAAQQTVEKSLQVLQLWRALADRYWEAGTLNLIGSAYSSARKYDQAIEYYNQALAIRREVKDRTGEGNALYNLGYAYDSLSRYEKAIEYYEQALVIYREVKDRADEGDTLNNLGLAYGSLNQYEKAIEYYNQALAISREVKNRASEGYALDRLGFAYGSLNRHEKAIEYYEQALAIGREVKDRAGEGNRLNNLGNAYRLLSRYEKAIEYYEQALAIRREVKDRVGEGNTLNNLGNSYRSLSRYEKAIEYYEQALAIRREVKDRTGERNTLSILGITYNSLSRYEKAIECHEQALVISREVKDRRSEGSALSSLGTAYLSLSRYEKAIECYEQALVISREVKDRRSEGSALCLLGNAYLSLGRSEKVIECFEQALVISREVKDRQGEGSALMSLGAAYDSLSRYEKAIECYEQALAIFREVKDHPGAGFLNADRLLEGVALTYLANTYRSLSQYEKAIKYYEQVVALYREMKIRLLEVVALGSQGMVYYLLSQYEKAIEYYEQALAITREVKSSASEGGLLDSLGQVYSSMGRYEKAIEYHEQALAISREVKDRAGEGRTLTNLGNAWHALGRADQATGYHEQALQIGREVKAPADEASALNRLMLDWKGRNQPSLAIFFGKQSVNVYQEIRSNIRSLDRDSQQSFLKSKEETYRRLADLLIAQGRLPEAEQVIKLLKEEEYFEFIRRDSSASGAAGRSTLTPEEAALEKRYREIADQLTGLGTERGALLEKKARTPEEEQRLTKLEGDLLVAGQHFQQFLTQLADEMSKSTEASAKVYNLRESQGLMEDLRELGAGTVALYTLVGEEKYRVILTTPDVQKGFEYAIKAADLNRKVLEFREVLQNPKLDPLPLAQELYQILLGPVAADLKAAKAQTLMWSLDGVLRYLPMAALHDGQQYLVERYRNVVFTPASNARLKDAPSKQWQALGLGVTKAHGDQIPALPGVAEEMHGIIREAGHEAGTNAKRGVLPGTIKLDEAFTEATMLSGLRQRMPVVHIASHFQFQPGNETDSALLLGDGSLLNLAKIKSLPNVFGGVELLTLSACNTATGSSGANGKEVEGFGVLAQRQGAKAVVASLWPVADRSTTVLMQEFYRAREAKAGTTKAEALRQAQIKLLRGEMQASKSEEKDRGLGLKKDASAKQQPFTPDPKRPYAHPYYWAPFILIGNWK